MHSVSDVAAHFGRVEEQLRSSLFSILETLNSPSLYLPSLGSSKADTEHVIDFSLPSISPYRFTISSTTAGTHPRPGVGMAMRRMLKDARF
ncbi:unnamed protein product [Protopolystoma xenopodis]|uniref:Uncharacterized protein n=1 Tax=Protopolystoma xenopodis TaxID=117903 RepID=A0A448XQM8_9PLAT|nr:unnamed protein product [Protopolystoma xenopodis]